MLTKDFRRLALLLGPVFLLFYITVSFFGHAPAIPGTGSVIDWTKTIHNDDTGSYSDPPPEPAPELAPIENVPEIQDEEDRPLPADGVPGNEDSLLPPNHPENLMTSPEQPHPDETIEDVPKGPEIDYQEIFSAAMPSKKFFEIEFGGVVTYNPNIIPHPTFENQWIIVAQRLNDNPKSLRYFEVACHAVFQEGILRCLEMPVDLPIAATPGKGCEGDLAYFDLNIGPHDARVFMAPDGPYIAYGSNSMFTCFGWHIQDLRAMVDDFELTDFAGPGTFHIATELQRPSPWSDIEKNWFLFWDADGQAYAHYDIVPKRAFAQILPDGSSGPNLAPYAIASDKKCMDKYMPPVTHEYESIHQATNSLQVTMCNRSDPTCVPDDTNTFIFTLFQYKSFYHYHSAYEPYVMMFKQRAPFSVHAMSNRPLWIHGRQKPAEGEQAEFFYVTSISWKSKDRRYHGFLDDALFIAFGIEDERSAGIDVLAGDLLKDMGLCEEVVAEPVSEEISEAFVPEEMTPEEVAPQDTPEEIMIGTISELAADAEEEEEQHM